MGAPARAAMENGLRREVSLIMMIAALQGAAGVSLAAAAAHVDGSAKLATASLFLMVHAGAGLALAALAASTPAANRLAQATFALQAGVTLFAADLALRVLGSGKLFTYAAPIGGSLTILSWLAVAIWAATRIARPGPDPTD